VAVSHLLALRSVVRMMLEEDIVWLNTLRQKNPDAYKRKLRIMGITDEDVPYREVKATPNGKINDPYKDKLFYMGGKPYVGEHPAGFMPTPEKEELPIIKKAVHVENRKTEEYSGEYYLVDGDNHIYEALQGIESLSKRDTVMVYVTQEGLRDNLNAMYGTRISVVMVKPGDQAVDNQIRTILGNAVYSDRRYKKIHIISHDNGYVDIIERYRKKYNLKNNELDLRKSIK